MPTPPDWINHSQPTDTHFIAVGKSDSKLEAFAYALFEINSQINNKYDNTIFDEITTDSLKSIADIVFNDIKLTITPEENLSESSDSLLIENHSIIKQINYDNGYGNIEINITSFNGMNSFTSTAKNMDIDALIFYLKGINFKIQSYENIDYNYIQITYEIKNIKKNKSQKAFDELEKEMNAYLESDKGDMKINENNDSKLLQIQND